MIRSSQRLEVCLKQRPSRTLGNKRKTNKWCKGKVGVLHDYEWRSTEEVHGYMNTPQGKQQVAEWRKQRNSNSAWHSMDLQVCKKCGRHGSYRRDGKEY